jgi:hypothetical protein
MLPSVVAGFRAGVTERRLRGAAGSRVGDSYELCSPCESANEHCRNLLPVPESPRLDAAYGVKFPKTAAKITDDLDQSERCVSSSSRTRAPAAGPSFCPAAPQIISARDIRAERHRERVYYRAMRLFHRRASKRRDKGEAQLVQERTSPANAGGAEAAGQHRPAEARPDPDQPGWGRTIGQAISKAREESASQE